MRSRTRSGSPCGPGSGDPHVIEPALALDALIADRKKRLTAFQDGAYSQRFEDAVKELSALERTAFGSDRVAREFEGDYKLHFHLAPPLLAKRDASGHLLKKSYGPWVATAFRWLAKGKRLRGTPFDIFGYTVERRTERALIARYIARMCQVLMNARPDQVATLLELARLPQTMRGYQSPRLLTWASAVEETNMQMLKDLMTQHVMVISPDASLKEAAARMRDADFGMMPVGENDRMIGVISDRDIATRAVAEGKGCDTLVRDVMSVGVTWAYEDDTLEQGARKMSEFQVRRLPIVDSNKRLVGIVSLGDVAVAGQDVRAAAAALTDISRP